ncbi:MAG: PAS domain S-box protein [Halochromatium sp.]|uniref:PAS domain S-box protein n=1 Tax=Halochromatium sp. TaxID=2049430 RepID=UPI00397D437C
MLTLLSLWALAGNTLTLPLFFGFDLLFGSIAAFLAMYWLGVRAGLLVAAIGGSATWLLWGHPYAMVIVVTEIAGVGWLRHRAQRRSRRRMAFAAADTLFWLALGIPLILVFYHLALGMEWGVAWLVALKQALNGIINAAVAGLIVLVAALIWHQRRVITFDRILFNILVLALLAPVLLLSVWQNKDLVHDLQPNAAHLIERGEHITMLESLGERLREQRHEPAFSLESPTRPPIDDLQGYFLRLLLTLLGLALAGVGLAAWLSTWLTRPLHQLIESTQRLPAAIAGSRPMPRLTETPIHETDELAETILGMADSLRLSFEQVEQEKQRQSRQQALATLQARLLSALVEQQGDADSFGALLCDEVEGILPHHRCLLLRQATDGTFTPFRRARQRGADLRATRLGEHPALIERALEALRTSRACPLTRADLVSDALEDSPFSLETATLSGLVLPIMGDSTVLVAIEQRPPAFEQTETGAAFARAILETAASTAGVAFEALQLRRRHQVLIDALSQAQTGIMITERLHGDDLITYVNAGFEAMTGYSAAEVIGRNCRFLQGDDRAQEARWRMREAIQAGEGCSVIMRNYRKDGSRFWNSLSLSPMRDREGQVTHYIGVQQDVTEAIETLERLRLSEARLQEAQAIAHVGSWELDLRSGQAQWSDETFRLLGFAPGAVAPCHETFLGVVARHDRERVRATIAALDAESASSVQIEHGVLGPDGVARTLLQQGRLHRDAEGAPTRLLGTSLDVTELRRTEASLREQEARYRLMVENVEDLIVRVDMEGRFEFVSPSYCKTFGRREDELLGKSFTPSVHPDDRAAVTAARASLHAPPHRCSLEQREHTAQGWRWLQWSNTAIRDDRGEVVGIIGVGRDITERKQAEVALAEREAMVSELLTLATGFVSVSDESNQSACEQALARVGDFIHADRCYLFHFGTDGREVTAVDEWTAPGVDSIQAHYLGLPTAKLPMMMAPLAVGEPVVIAAVDEFGDSDWAVERRRVETQQVQSLLLAPLQLEERLFGFIGAEMVHAPRVWSRVEIQFLQLFANILVAGEQRAHSLAALRQSNARYDALARQSRTMTWELDAEGRFSYLSEVCEAVLGHPVHEMLGQHYRVCIDASEGGERIAQAAEIIAHQQPFQDFVVPCRHRTGQLLWLATDGGPVLAEDGQLLGYQGTTKDVTERELALQRLAHSEAQLSAIFDHSPLGIALVGQDRRPLLVNQALLRLLGTKADVLAQMRLDAFTSPNDLRAALEAFDELFAGKRPTHRFTSRYLRADGEMLWVDLRLSLLSTCADAEPLALLMVENVTELHEARERQRVAEQELGDYAAQLEHMIDVVNLSQPYAEQIESLLRLARRTLRFDTAAIWQIDQARVEHLLLAVPHDGPQALQAVPSTLVAEAIAELGSPVLMPMRATADASVASAAEQAAMIGLALDSLTPDGHSERLLLILAGTTAIGQLDLGQSQLLRLIAQRISAVRYRQHLQDNLVQARERETIGHLASGVAHDFNNLLGVIDANLFFIASALHEQHAADPEVDQVLAETQSALGQAKVLTSGMLTMSGSGKIPLEPLDVADAIGELSSIIEQVLPARIRLELAIAPGLQVFSNRAFLQSALLNLSLNARDAIGGEGTLTIAARPLRWEATTPLVVGEVALGDCVEIRVSDTGTGIPPELVDQIFKPLFTTKAKSRGHGFGLFMVGEFVARAQAGLSVDSVPGAGSCFRLLLPAEVPVEGPVEGPAAGQAEDARKALSEALDEQDEVLTKALTAALVEAPADSVRSGEAERAPAEDRVTTAASKVRVASESPRVLLVEDDRRVRDALSRVLKADGIAVETAEHGGAALARLASASAAPIDLVLSDIAMPVMDGLELHARLLKQYPQLPVILMTGQQAHWDAPLNQRGEPTLILRKPIDFTTLKVAIREQA